MPFQSALPRDTHARTSGRLRRSGPTLPVLFLNALEWVSLSLHQSLGHLLGVALAIALSSRYELATLQYLLLLPFGWLLLVEPVLRAGSAMHRQLEAHQQHAKVWRAPESIADEPEH